jgi:hypothetical protein
MEKKLMILFMVHMFLAIPAVIHYKQDMAHFIIYINFMFQNFVKQATVTVLFIGYTLFSH